MELRLLGSMEAVMVHESWIRIFGMNDDMTKAVEFLVEDNIAKE